MFKYTVCFVKKGNEILMLNREKDPLMGVWNGVGGKIEKGESPDDCARREVWEETDIRVDDYFSKGTVTWEAANGLYVYLYEVDPAFIYETPKKTREGILEWKSIDWILHPDNQGIAKLVPYYLPILLSQAGDYFLHYHNNQISIKQDKQHITKDI